MDKKDSSVLALAAAVFTLALAILLSTTGIGRPSNDANFVLGYDKVYISTMGGTASMAPTINVGDTVLWVEVGDMGELRVGDIIVFKHPTLIGVDNICHRIVEIELVAGEYRFRTKGDSLAESDRHPVPEGNVHGVVIGVIYKAGGPEWRRIEA